MRRSELTVIRREHVEIDSHCAAIRPARTQASQDLTVVVPIDRDTASRWCPVTTLEGWLGELTAVGAAEIVWPWITKGGNYRSCAGPVS